MPIGVLQPLKNSLNFVIDHPHKWFRHPKPTPPRYLTKFAQLPGAICGANPAPSNLGRAFWGSPVPSTKAPLQKSAFLQRQTRRMRWEEPFPAGAIRLTPFRAGTTLLNTTDLSFCSSEAKPTAQGTSPGCGFYPSSNRDEQQFIVKHRPKGSSRSAIWTFPRFSVLAAGLVLPGCTQQLHAPCSKPSSSQDAPGCSWKQDWGLSEKEVQIN